MRKVIYGKEQHFCELTYLRYSGIKKIIYTTKTEKNFNNPRSENRPKANKEKEEIQSHRTDTRNKKPILTTFGIELDYETSQEATSRWAVTPGHPEVVEEEEPEEVMVETTGGPEMLQNRSEASKITSSTSVQQPTRVIMSP